MVHLSKSKKSANWKVPFITGSLLILSWALEIRYGRISFLKMFLSVMEESFEAMNKREAPSGISVNV